MARRRGYKRTFFQNHSVRISVARHLFSEITGLWQLYDAGELSGASFCASQIYTLVAFLHQGKAIGGGLPQGTRVACPDPLGLDDGTCSWPWKHTLKGVPWSVNSALKRWHSDPEQLVLLDRVLDLNEVLELQCEGRRCVSFFRSMPELESLILDGRDAWSFLIHDLIHADHFFADPELARGQIQFYRWLRGQLKSPKLRQLLQNQQFSHAVSYVVSDMNAHPQHLVQTLVAELLLAVRHQKQVADNEKIPLSELDSFLPGLEDFVKNSLGYHPGIDCDSKFGS